MKTYQNVISNRVGAHPITILRGGELDEEVVNYSNSFGDYDYLLARRKSGLGLS